MTTIQSVADAVVCAYTAQYNTDLATRDAAVQRLLASHEALRAALEQERGLLLTFNAETAEVTGALRAERDAAVAALRYIAEECSVANVVIDGVDCPCQDCCETITVALKALKALTPDA